MNLSLTDVIPTLSVALSIVIEILDPLLDLFGCFIIFLIIYSAFVLFGYLIFGQELDTYKDVFSSAVTLDKRRDR
jgi:hypothetical protein